MSASKYRTSTNSSDLRMAGLTFAWPSQKSLIEQESQQVLWQGALALASVLAFARKSACSPGRSTSSPASCSDPPARSWRWRHQPHHRARNQRGTAAGCDVASRGGRRLQARNGSKRSNLACALAGRNSRCRRSVRAIFRSHGDDAVMYPEMPAQNAANPALLPPRAWHNVSVPRQNVQEKSECAER
jgi:hypothetical protein